ncbi:hypothetical protein BGZ74_009939 [Mortierella antarctica]|nr:hypothetical protein BGZ74_009939 [Mortierella antarctica]
MDIYSFSSTFDSRPSARSSTSSIGNWAPRARSSSVSSQGSTGSVNLDAIIASESDLNEEKPLELVEGDEVDWTSKEERPVVENAQPSLPTPLMVNSYSTTTPRTTHLEDQGEDYWTGSISENEIGDDEDDEEFGEALREFSQISLKTNSVQVRGLGFSSGLPSSSRISAPSSRFPQKKNHFDLDADYMDISAGFDNLRSGSRTSTYSNSGTASNRSSISKMPTPSGLVQPKSGLKAPGASRLAQPGARSLVQPKSTGSRGTTPVSQAPKSGQAPKGLQAPRTGLQAPKTQVPRASTATRAPTKPGVAPPPRTGPSSLAKPQVKPGTRLIPPSAPASRVNTTRSQLAPPATIKRPNIPTSTSNRTSLLQAPASLASRSTGTVGATVARMNAASAQSPNNPGLTSPRRSLTMPSGLASPTRIRTGGSAMVSPTSSQSSTSSLPSLGYGARDSSQRLMNATGAASSTKSRLMGPRIATGRTSMYGSSALRMEDDYEEDTYYDDYRHPDYAVLTPPQSPSAKGSRLSMVPPTRLAIPTTTTSRIGRPSSPAAMVTGLRGSQVHGLVSPKAGHHRY